MEHKTLDTRTIDTLRDRPELIPVIRDNFQTLPVRIINRAENPCRNYLSPNRREFYKILLVTEGSGVLSIGTHTYYLDDPTIIFIHPSDIISWQKRSCNAGGYSCNFQKTLLDHHPLLKATLDKYTLFLDKKKSVIRLNPQQVAVLNPLFQRMLEEERSGQKLNEDVIQAYLQLVMIECARIADFPEPNHVSEEYKHVHEFFHLLEKETAHINYTQPIAIKTAKEFAANLSVHPNYLNALLKKYTGQNVSTHIRNRLLEEAKSLLLQTNWNLQDIGYSIGFADQPNFSLFFKKNTGITPAEFRRSSHQLQRQTMA
ncbi:AraC family transcriptional regulator [Siphonobacter sp. BAB-5385]|uniref:AraC family transcriptional regulator n=1 Tax=Siphonobacter sp. BAB-5385 TaxID=1864822 RepID=UPI000B9DE2B8|nr:response regulator transcription factor [Siphonobacter sp. BAB-5385]OZI06505.1 AraC family transcriptional regulator [Siphonobacter sp. BAB-5385]